MAKAGLYVAAVALTVALVVFAIYRTRNRPPAIAMTPQGYSVDVQHTDFKDSTKSYVGKMYVRWGKGISGMRTEYVYADRRRILLNLTSLNQTWMLDPEHQTYWAVKTRTTLKLRSLPKGGPRLIEVPEHGSFQNLGAKTIAGRETQGFEITEPTSNTKLVWTAWEDDRLGTVLLIDKPGILRTEATRVDVTVPGEDLFRVPEGYTKIEAPAS
jgi:hypothetical protein